MHEPLQTRRHDPVQWNHLIPLRSVAGTKPLVRDCQASRKPRMRTVGLNAKANCTGLSPRTSTPQKNNNEWFPFCKKSNSLQGSSPNSLKTGPLLERTALNLRSGAFQRHPSRGISGLCGSSPGGHTLHPKTRAAHVDRKDGWPLQGGWSCYGSGSRLRVECSPSTP